MTQQLFTTTRDLLLNAEIPTETKTYKPVTHRQLMDLTLETIDKAGFRIASETYSAARDGRVANGRYAIQNIADSEMQLQIGWQNSYDKSLSLKFAIGTRILVCSNGCVSGDFGAFKKKHQGEIQTFAPTAIADYIKSSGDVFRRIQSDRESMKQIELTRRTKAELIGRMIIEEQFIQSTQLNIIARELDKPTHDYGAPDSLWELYNYTTFAMKEVHPSNWMDSHIDAHKFFMDQAIPVVETEELPMTSHTANLIQMIIQS